MSEQIRILTEMKFGQKENGDIILNPFYGSNDEKVKRNISYAEKTYKDVFRRFIYVWYLSGIKSVPPRDWESFRI